MRRFLGLALLIGGLEGCHGNTILLGNPPDGGGADAGPVPTVELLPNPLDFGGISVGGTYQLNIKVANAGGTVDAGVVPALVFFESAQPSPPFFSGPDGGVMLSLAVLDRTLGVTFAPTTPGSAKGHLNYKVCAKGDGGGPCSPTQSITLQGNGL